MAGPSPSKAEHWRLPACRSVVSTPAHTRDLRRPGRPARCVPVWCGPAVRVKPKPSCNWQSCCGGHQYLDHHRYLRIPGETTIIRSGSPPGYVGWVKAASITGTIRQKPYSVVLVEMKWKKRTRMCSTCSTRRSIRAKSQTVGRLIDCKNIIFLTSRVSGGGHLPMTRKPCRRCSGAGRLVEPTCWRVEVVHGAAVKETLTTVIAGVAVWITCSPSALVQKWSLNRK